MYNIRFRDMIHNWTWKALGAVLAAKKGFVLLFCLPGSSTHSASNGSAALEFCKFSEPESKEMALEWDLNDEVLLGEVPSIIPGPGEVELTISSHCSGLGRGLVVEAAEEAFSERLTTKVSLEL